MRGGLYCGLPGRDTDSGVINCNVIDRNIAGESLDVLGFLNFLSPSLCHGRILSSAFAVIACVCRPRWRRHEHEPFSIPSKKSPERDNRLAGTKPSQPPDSQRRYKLLPTLGTHLTVDSQRPYWE